MADVFISYARSTVRIAKAAADALSSAGFSAWMDAELPAHRAYADVISERLDEARAVLVLWSKEAAASHWVRSEANRARERGTLVQASVDGTFPPMPFDQIQCADLRGWRGKLKSPQWRRIVGDIAELVGSRQAPAVLAAGPTHSGPPIGRRHLFIGGGAAVLIAGVSYWGFGSLQEYKPPPEAELLRQKALAIMQDGRPAELNQAIIYLKEATQLAPDFAAAWGGLAMNYAIRKFQVPLAARAGEDARCRSAASRALELDPTNPLAHSALLLLTPTYRHWREIEQRAGALVGRIPPIPLTFHGVGDLLVDVGRSSDALEIYAKIDRKQFLIPSSERTIIQALWNAGRLQLAEQRLDEAAGRWPQHYAVWNLRTAFLTHTGRADEAVRLLEDASVRPIAFPEEQLKAALVTARAIAGAFPAQEAIRFNLDLLNAGSPDVLTYLNRKSTLGQQVAQRCAALGDADTAFALLTGYYLGEGPWARIAPPAGDMDRSTFCLFEQPMQSLWPDPRFAALMRRIGLQEYWRETGADPDFQHA